MAAFFVVLSSVRNGSSNECDWRLALIRNMVGVWFGVQM